MKKGAMNTWENIGSIILVLFILGLMFTPLGSNIKGFFQSAEEGTSCSTSLADGVCMRECEEGFVGVPARGCDYRCCVAQTEAAEVLKAQIQAFTRIYLGLNLCQSRKEDSFCDGAHREILELIDNEEVRISFAKQGTRTIARFHYGPLSEGDVKGDDAHLNYEFMGGDGIWGDNNVVEIYYDGNNVVIDKVNAPLTGFNYNRRHILGRTAIEINYRR